VSTGTRMAVFVLAALGLLSARSEPEPPKTVPEGRWGGNHVSLEVGPDGARVEFDTAHGTIDKPLALDAEGRFELPGKLVLERPGPVRMGDEERVEQARFEGSLRDGTLSIQATLGKSGRVYGKFTATLGGTPRLHKMY
jgi:hypothetical protein